MKVTIKRAEKEKDDIFFVGNLVIDTVHNRIVLIGDFASDYPDCFFGIDITTGEAAKNWSKECFEQFHGTITLEK